MASAEVARQQVQVALRLSEEEAQFLYHVLGSVGGDPVLSPRRHARAICNALQPLLEPTGQFSARLKDLRSGTAQGLYFNPDPRITA